VGRGRRARATGAPKGYSSGDRAASHVVAGQAPSLPSAKGCYR
jgi:hypothetical protein